MWYRVTVTESDCNLFKRVRVTGCVKRSPVKSIQITSAFCHQLYKEISISVACGQSAAEHSLKVYPCTPFLAASRANADLWLGVRRCAACCPSMSRVLPSQACIICIFLLTMKLNTQLRNAAHSHKVSKICFKMLCRRSVTTQRRANGLY